MKTAMREGKSKSTEKVVKGETIENVVKIIPVSSLIIPVVSIAIALLAPIMTLGIVSLDPSLFCNQFPDVCIGLNLAVKSPMHIARDAANENLGFSPVIYLEFFNRMEIPVDTYWKDYSGEEQFWFTMEPFSYTGNISSIRGHVWSFRSSETSEMLFEESIALNHCGKIHIAPAEHIEALRQYCTSTGRGVIGYWPRAPAVRQIPRASPVGTRKDFHTDNLPFESYEGRSTNHNMEIETISNEPHMLRIDNFLSDQECEYLIDLSSSRLSQSGDEAASAWLEHGESPIVSSITRRVFDLMGFEPDVETFYFAEKMQVSRFTRGQEYLPHFDAMDITTMQRTMPHNRYATVMMYLNSVDEKDGGADVWPRANKANEFLKSPCEADFQLQPTKGTLIVMYSMFGDGVIDESSLHGSCPLKNEHNEKWISNFYFWDPFVQWSPEQATL